MYVAEAFRNAWRSRREICVIYNGVVVEPLVIPNGSQAIQEEFGILEDAPLIVMATRLQRQKGVHVFLDAAARVVKYFPLARFLVVGGTLFGLEEDYPVELCNQAARLGLRRSVIFTGYRPDVHRFLAAADLVVHSSVAPESFGMVLLEAMALGKPVIASDIGGPREIVEDGVTGLLVPPNEPEVLAQAIVRLLGDSERRRKMAEAEITRVHTYFGADRMVRQLEMVYEQVV